MVVVQRADGGVQKSPKNLAELCWNLTASAGMPEVRLADHDVEPLAGPERCLCVCVWNSCVSSQLSVLHSV